MTKSSVLNPIATGFGSLLNLNISHRLNEEDLSLLFFSLIESLRFEIEFIPTAAVLIK